VAAYHNLLQEVRVQLPDTIQRQWEDMDLLTLAARAYRRLNHILFRNSLAVGKIYGSITTVPGTNSYDLPTDFMVDDGLFRDDNLPLLKIDDRAYESLLSADECSAYLLRGRKVLLAGTPSTERTLTLVYWPLLSASAVTMGADTPYESRFDDLISAFLVAMCRAVDGQGGSTEAQLYQDIEAGVLETYAHLNPIMTRQRGWL
jgi:hypothetical protein